MTIKPLIIAALIESSFGWDSNGHRIISHIAGKYITEKTEKYLGESIPLTGKDISKSIALHSVWADQLHGVPGYEWSLPMHFTHTDNKCSPFDVNRDCPSGVCLVTAIAKFSTIATDPTLKREEREEAVKFLIHFIADAHQPLHVGFKSDKGGNRLFIKSVQENLHHVWDTDIVARYIEAQRIKKKQPNWNYYDLASEIMDEEDFADVENLANQIPPPNDTLDYNSVEDYAADIVSETSSLYTCNVAYKHEPIKPKIGNQLIWKWIKDNDSLTNAYFHQGIGVVRQQFVRAGVRLGELLNAIAYQYFDKKRALTIINRNTPTQTPTKSPIKSSPNKFALLDDSESDSEN